MTVLPPFSVTQRAIQQIGAVGGSVRIDVAPGGCCGLTYRYASEPGRGRRTCRIGPDGRGWTGPPTDERGATMSAPPIPEDPGAPSTPPGAPIPDQPGPLDPIGDPVGEPPAPSPDGPLGG